MTRSEKSCVRASSYYAGGQKGSGMKHKTQKYTSAVKSYGTRGTRVRSAEGSGMGRSRAAAADAKILGRAGAARASRLGPAK